LKHLFGNTNPSGGLSSRSTARINRTPLRDSTAALCAGLALSLAQPAAAGGHHGVFKFDMVRSAGVVTAGCLPDATAKVRIRPAGAVERMVVTVDGLPPRTNFDFFVTQLPSNGFGLSWYQGDIETDDEGHGEEVFIGRFNEETFVIAPQSRPAPQIHDRPIKDAETNPATGPVHTYHLGLWFNSPDDAAAAGCTRSAVVTPFNGEHNAGVQVLNTSNFPDLAGPLLSVKAKP
jgi:hypothetical protein